MSAHTPHGSAPRPAHNSRRGSGHQLRARQRADATRLVQLVNSTESGVGSGATPAGLTGVSEIVRLGTEARRHVRGAALARQALVEHEMALARCLRGLIEAGFSRGEAFTRAGVSRSVGRRLLGPAATTPHQQQVSSTAQAAPPAKSTPVSDADDGPPEASPARLGPDL